MTFNSITMAFGYFAYGVISLFILILLYVMIENIYEWTKLPSYTFKWVERLNRKVSDLEEYTHNLESRLYELEHLKDERKMHTNEPM